jgi:saccharopine dehydrogenase (NAD+, L-lysine-forming)
MAALLHREMPDATSLDLAFAGGGSASRGTLRTAIEGISQGGWIREDGRLKSVPTGWKSQEVAFADKPRNVVTIPWGDLATAYRTTGIPNIRTWMAVPRSSARWMRWSNPFKGVMGTRMAQGMLNRWIDGQAVGPDADTRATARSQVWGRVVNEAGKAMEGTLTTSEGYRFTALGAVAAVQRVSEATPGAHTPSTAFGADFASTIQGVTVGSFTLID